MPPKSELRDGAKQRPILWLRYFLQILEAQFLRLLKHGRRCLKNVLVRIRQAGRSEELHDQVQNVETPEEHDRQEIINQYAIQHIGWHQRECNPSLLPEGHTPVQQSLQYLVGYFYIVHVALFITINYMLHSLYQRHLFIISSSYHIYI